MSRPRICGRRTLFVAVLLSAFGASLTTQAGELEQRFADTLRRAEAGDAAAMYNVGEMYELGMGTDSDRAESMVWYRLAADKGHPEGAYQIGYAYYWGKAGLDRDRRQAHAWFQRAAEAGSHAAMPYLAKMYSLGQGVSRDKEKAALWSARAASAPSALHSQPPAPEASRDPAPSPEQKTEPAAAPEAAPEPVRKVTERPAPQADETTSEVATKPRPTAAKPQPATRTDRKRRQMQRLLASWWQKDQRPALYLPSSQTDCSISEAVIYCQSEPRRSSLLGRPYRYRFRSNMKAFDRLGRFTLRYWPDVTDILPIPPGGYATGDDAPEPPSDEEIRLRVERPAEEMSCEMFKDTHLTCVDDAGNNHEFRRLDKAQSAPPASDAADPVADRPAEDAATAAQTESQTPAAQARDQGLVARDNGDNSGGFRRSGPPNGRR